MLWGLQLEVKKGTWSFLTPEHPLSCRGHLCSVPTQIQHLSGSGRLHCGRLLQSPKYSFQSEEGPPCSHRLVGKQCHNPHLELISEPSEVKVVTFLLWSDPGILNGRVPPPELGENWLLRDKTILGHVV